MNSKEIIKWLVDNDIVIEDVIDAIIKENGIVGVGLISFADGMKEHIHSHIKPITEEERMR